MKKQFIFLLVALSISHYLSAQSDSTNCTISLKAIDLSENMSRLSTKDDEVILLLYKKTNSEETLHAPVCQTEFVLDSTRKEKTLTNLTLQNSNYLIFILERDDERTIEQIDPIFRVYYQEIAKLYAKKDWLGLEKYMGDSDLLGYVEFSLSKSESEIEFKGRQNMDSYHYKLTINHSK